MESIEPTVVIEPRLRSIKIFTISCKFHPHGRSSIAGNVSHVVLRPLAVRSPHHQEEMGVLREGKGHAIATLVTLGKLVTLGENGIMRQAVLVMNHPIKPGLRDSLAGAVNGSSRLVAVLPGVKMFDHDAVR